MRPERIAGAQGDARGGANTHAIVGIEIGRDMEAVWPKKKPGTKAGRISLGEDA